MSYVVVHDKWKLLTNKDGSYAELYNIVADPYEKNDLASENAEAVEALRKKLSDWQSTLPAKPTGDVFSVERKSL